jgi:hypothetical protein
MNVPKPVLPGLTTKFHVACVLGLIASGILHGGMFVALDRAWDDPLSFRKATLFGISTGVTLWSCLWVMSYLRPSKFDPRIRDVLSASLVLEVLLITLQTWRGELSHFNHDGLLNGLIELAMLILITIAVGSIFLITCRVWLQKHFEQANEPMIWAIRWGMLLLSLSAVLGFAITWIGQYQISQGLDPTHWRTRGVLKFPHGAALHAIQTLAVIAWVVTRLRLPNSTKTIHAIAAAHLCWLVFALYQTFSGRDRFEFDSVSLLLLAATVLSSLYASIPLINRLINPLSVHN